MKKIALLILCVAMLYSNNELFAQWNVGGNNLPAGGGALGSNNNRPVIFETNNVERGRLLNTSGFWGFGPNFGLVAPLAQVHIDANTAADNPLRVDVAGVNQMLLNNVGRMGLGTLFPSARLSVNSAAAEDGLRVQIAGSTKLLVASGGGVSVGSPSIAPANGLFVSGNAGIGTSAPVTKLQITGGVDASLTGNGFLVTGSTTSTNIVMDDNEIIARSNGVASALFLNNNGGNLIIDGTNSGSRLGLGTSAPVADVHVFHAFGSFTNGLRLQNDNAPNNYWNFYTRGAGDLELSVNGNIVRGLFSGVNGVYTPFSDRRLKKDIEKATDVMDKVLQLEVTKYHVLQSKPADKKYYGLIAQDVEKIFPEIVYKSKADNAEDYYALDYSAFGVLAIKAIQEQQKTITTLEERIAKLESALNATSSTKFLSGVDASSVVLEQNQPNPFNQTTIIRYKIPSGANAQINIYDANGAMVKTMRATENGQAQINASELKAGTYTYALLVDGKPLVSKKMVMLK